VLICLASSQRILVSSGTGPWFAVLGFGFGGIAGLITYGAAELAYQLVDCLDERMQSGGAS
jgi:hypothetical protein